MSPFVSTITLVTCNCFFLWKPSTAVLTKIHGTSKRQQKSPWKSMFHPRFGAGGLFTLSRSSMRSSVSESVRRCNCFSRVLIMLFDRSVLHFWLLLQDEGSTSRGSGEEGSNVNTHSKKYKNSSVPVTAPTVSAQCLIFMSMFNQL